MAQLLHVQQHRIHPGKQESVIVSDPRSAAPLPCARSDERVTRPLRIGVQRLFKVVFTAPRIDAPWCVCTLASATGITLRSAVLLSRFSMVGFFQSRKSLVKLIDIATKFLYSRNLHCRLMRLPRRQERRCQPRVSPDTRVVHRHA